MMKTAKVTALPDLRRVAADILSSVAPSSGAAVLSISGDLGAGKTAFVKELAHHLGVTREVTSPTFVIMRSYAIPNHSRFKVLTHIDAYRIESDDEMKVLDVEELFRDPGQLICIEWPERIQRLMPEGAYPISLAIHEGTTRIVTHGT